MTQDESKQHTVPASLYVKVWVALVILTGITVGVSFLDMQKFTVFTAMLVASVKASLVLLYFMHILYEKKIYAIMVITVFAVYAIFIILTFTDYPFR